MDKLKKNFITANREYKEGEVFVFRQKFTVDNVHKATINIITT